MVDNFREKFAEFDTLPNINNDKYVFLNNLKYINNNHFAPKTLTGRETTPFGQIQYEDKTVKKIAWNIQLVNRRS